MGGGAGLGGGAGGGGGKAGGGAAGGVGGSGDESACRSAVRIIQQRASERLENRGRWETFLHDTVLDLSFQKDKT